MAKNNSSNQDYTNNSDGWDLSGGTTKRKLTVTGGDISLTGSGSNTYTFPASTDTLVGRTSSDTLTNKILTQSSWTAVTFQNSWVDFGGTAQTCAYLKDSMGFVHLKGLMKSGTIGAVAFNLPAGFRPLAFARFGSISNGSFGAIDLSAAGDFTPAAGSNTSFSLDGITFRAEN